MHRPLSGWVQQATPVTCVTMIKSDQPLDAKSFNWWQTTRERGKWRYVVLYGVILWGGLTALLFTMLPVLLGNSFDWYRAAASFLLFPIGGIGWGVYMWNLMEKRFSFGKK